RGASYCPEYRKS
ncbi:UNC93A protein, partial [Danaus plexippus plexippus]